MSSWSPVCLVAYTLTARTTGDGKVDTQEEDDER
jgi:hypothetical protein